MFDVLDTLLGECVWTLMPYGTHNIAIPSLLWCVKALLLIMSIYWLIKGMFRIYSIIS